MWIALFFCAMGLQAHAFADLPEVKDVERLTRHFGIWRSPAGQEHFVIFASGDEIAKVIPLPQQAVRYSRFAEHFALVSYGEREDEQIVEVFDLNGSRVSHFIAPRDRTIGAAVGGLLSRFGYDLCTEFPFDIELLSFDGATLARTTLAGRTIIHGIQNQAGDWLWASGTRNPPQSALHRMNSKLDILWTYDLGDRYSSTLALSDSGRYAAVGGAQLGSPIRDEIFTLLGPDGKEIVSEEAPGSRFIFSPTDDFILLLGWKRIELRRTMDGKVIWTDPNGITSCMVIDMPFSRDGKQFYIMQGGSRGQPGLKGDVWLTTHTITSDGVSTKEKRVKELSQAQINEVVEVVAEADGSLIVITRHSGSFRLVP